LFAELNAFSYSESKSFLNLTAFLLFVGKVDKDPTVPKVVDDLDLFTPHITIFREMLPELNAVQNSAIRLLVTDVPACHSFFQSVCRSPVLFTGVMYGMAALIVPSRSPWVSFSQKTIVFHAKVSLSIFASRLSVSKIFFLYRICDVAFFNRPDKTRGFPGRASRCSINTL
jgi:hypothetical protein